METIITFEIAGEQYTMFVEGILKKKYYLSKENKGSVLADPIPVKVTANERSNYVLAGMFTGLYEKKEISEEKSIRSRLCRKLLQKKYRLEICLSR